MFLPLQLAKQFSPKNVKFALGLLMAFSLPACGSAFFVDQGHVDDIDGVKFDITQPYLFVKKAFKLRGENLSVLQLETLRDAMPSIAVMTHQILGAENAQALADLERQGVRNLRQRLGLHPNTPLYVKTIQHWVVTTHTIEFTTDYFYSENRRPAVTFRDNYRFAKTDLGWQFSGHPLAQPEGVLICTHTPAGWMRCDQPASPSESLGPSAPSALKSVSVLAVPTAALSTSPAQNEAWRQ
jgi:hypothetical protein